MAKEKGTKGPANRHLHARTAFLYQAASYLALQAHNGGNCNDVNSTSVLDPEATKIAEYGVALQLGSHVHAVSRKGQVRLSTDLKRSMCKTCNAALIPGQTSTQTVENASKNGAKPWADVLVVECKLCGSKKRFPIGATAQATKGKRMPSKDHTSSQTVKQTEQSTTPAANSSAELSKVLG